MEPLNVPWLRCKESPGPAQGPCKHWVFATDGYDLKIDTETAAKFARSIADELPGHRHTDLTLRRTFKAFGSRRVEVILTRPAAEVIIDAVLDRVSAQGAGNELGTPSH